MGLGRHERDYLVCTPEKMSKFIVQQLVGTLYFSKPKARHAKPYCI